MSLAARPTFHHAQGGRTVGERANAPPVHHTSSKMQPGQKVLKRRKIGQNSEVEIQQKDMLAELQRKERARLGLPPITIADSNSTESEEAQRKREAVAALADLDAEDSAPQQGRQRYDLDEDQSESSSSDSSDDDDDEDEEEDTAALLRELEKIRAERAAEKEAQERAKAAKEEEERNASIMAGNPLLQRHEPGTPAESDTSSQAGFRVQRKWYDETVFKNQSRGQEDGNGKRFINDLLRSDFHKKFISKYIQ